MQALIQPSRIPVRRTIAFAAAVMCALALAACTTSRTTGTLTSLNDLEGTAAGSEVNLESLSQVIAQNPSDASTYNVRGSAYG
ncbi:MAG: hypothetical protein WD099_01420, partial [Dongiaceae bacterium]